MSHVLLVVLLFYFISLLVKPHYYFKFLNQAFQLIKFLIITANKKKIQKNSANNIYIFPEDTTVIMNNT